MRGAARSEARRLALAAMALVMLGAAPAAAADVLGFAAASLKNALDDAAAAYRPPGGDLVRISYAASSALAKQLESGAPADIFVSADQDWMDYAQRQGIINPATPKDFLASRLVLEAPATSNVAVTNAPNFPIAAGVRHRRPATFG